MTTSGRDDDVLADVAAAARSARRGMTWQKCQIFVPSPIVAAFVDVSGLVREVPGMRSTVLTRSITQSDARRSRGADDASAWRMR